MSLFAFGGDVCNWDRRYDWLILLEMLLALVAVPNALFYTAYRAYTWLSAGGYRRPATSVAIDGVLCGLAVAMFLAAIRLAKCHSDFFDGSWLFAAEFLIVAVQCPVLLLYIPPWWWANVLFGCGLVCRTTGDRKAAGVLGLAAGMLALGYWLAKGRFEPAPVWSGDWARYSYWAWLASLCVFPSAALVEKWLRPNVGASLPSARRSLGATRRAARRAATADRFVPRENWGKAGPCPRCGFSYRWDGSECSHCTPADAV